MGVRPDLGRWTDKRGAAFGFDPEDQGRKEIVRLVKN
jgi:hypothetical protein